MSDETFRIDFPPGFQIGKTRRIKLDNGVVIHSTWYSKPSRSEKWPPARVRQMDDEYRRLKEFADRYGLFVCQVPVIPGERVLFEQRLLRRAA